MSHLVPVRRGYFGVGNSSFMSAGQEAAGFISLYETFP